MNILIFGATGMVGQGVLRECLTASDVSRVTTVGRSSVPQQHPKLRQFVHADLMNLTALQPHLSDCDACFFCLGVSSSGLTEQAYRHLTHDITLAVANSLSKWNPQMRIVYVSGSGTDSTEQGSSMWARVKGMTENDLLQLPFAGVYLFRPGVIQPLHGIQSKTAAYRWAYMLTKPLLPLARALFPSSILSSQDMGQAMLNVARHGGDLHVLEPRDIALLARQSGNIMP